MAERKRDDWSPEAVAIVLGVAGSMAGNVAWAVTLGSAVLVGVGVLMSLVLPVTVTLWRRTPAPSHWFRRAERVVVMTAICAGAAVYTLVHATELLASAGLPAAIAWVPPAVMELLVVQAARASEPGRDSGTPSRRDKRTPQVKGGTSRGTSSPSRPSASRDTSPSASPAPSPSASPVSAPPRPPSVDERPGPRPVPELPASRPVPVPEPSTDPDDYAHLDEPAPGDESPEDRRKRLDRNKKRRLRAARKAEEEAS